MAERYAEKQRKALAEELGLAALDFQLFFPEKTVSFQDMTWGDWHQGGESCVFTGGWKDVTVTWRFVRWMEGYRVDLEVRAERPLYCRKLSNLSILYRGEDLEQRRIIRKEGLFQELVQLETKSCKEVISSMISGIFSNSREPGLFIGTILPQNCLHFYTFSELGKDLELVSATEYPYGLSQQTSLATETSYITSSFSCQEALKRYYSHIPPMEDPVEQPVGWNSWDYYFADVSEQDMIENMEEIRKDPVLREHLRYIVVDMGWEHREGDWYPCYTFPNGLESYAAQVRSRGFIPGIWTSPIQMQQLCKTATRHNSFLIRDEYGDPVVVDNQFVVDPTHPEGEAFIRQLYTRLYQAGFRLFKVDFVGNLTQVDRFYNRTMGHYQVIRELFRIIRECVTPESHIIGCSLPKECGPGIVQSSRTGIDIHNQWTHAKWAFEYLQTQYGLHRRIAVNDPDFLIVRGRDTSLEEETNVLNPREHHPAEPSEFDYQWRRGPVFSYTEAKTWCAVVLLAGGSIFLSDRLSMLNALGRELIHTVLRYRVQTNAVPLDLMDSRLASLWIQQEEKGERLYVINWTDHEKAFSVSFPPNTECMYDIFTGMEFRQKEGSCSICLSPHDCVVLTTALVCT